MDVDVTSIAFKGKEADATVTFRAKGADASSGLEMRYTLEQKSGKWVVKGQGARPEDLRTGGEWRRWRGSGASPGPSFAGSGRGEEVKRVAVLGGGPAGAFAAAQLAAAGLSTVVLDEKLAWEKPCGGGLTYKAYNQYPFLMHNDAPKKLITRDRAGGPGRGRSDAEAE